MRVLLLGTVPCAGDARARAALVASEEVCARAVELVLSWQFGTHDSCSNSTLFQHVSPASCEQLLSGGEEMDLYQYNHCVSQLSCKL